MITTIISDLSEVVLHGMWGFEDLLSSKYGIEIENDVLYRMRVFEQFHHGKITEEQFWQSIISVFSWNLTVSDLKETVRENFGEIKGTRDIYENLVANGYKLGLLSVHSREWIEYCEKQFDYHKLFHSILYSYEVAICKPERKAYELILEKLGAVPEECVFIDDIKQNVEAAEQLGITAIQFQSAKQLRHDLEKAGIALDTPVLATRNSITPAFINAVE